MSGTWRVYRRQSIKGLRWSLISTALVLPVSIIINPDFSAPGYWRSILGSLRVGAQIGAFVWIGHLIFWATIVGLVPGLLPRCRESKALHLSLGIALMFGGLLLSSYLEPFISGGHWKTVEITLSGLIGSLIFLAFYLSSAYRQTREQMQRERAGIAEARFNTLKMQMRPHFLFNSLNSLSELIECDPSRAGEMSQRLADLYRAILDVSKTPTVTLAKEIRIAQLYLDIEKIRFGSRLQTVLNVSPWHENAHVPSLVVQTLAENAVKHGISKARGGGQITVAVVERHNDLWLEVRNTGAPLEDTRTENTGLTNTRERLAITFGENHGFALTREQNETVARFRLRENAATSESETVYA